MGLTSERLVVADDIQGVDSRVTSSIGPRPNDHELLLSVRVNFGVHVVNLVAQSHVIES